jgi:hypothetical protein
MSVTIEAKTKDSKQQPETKQIDRYAEISNCVKDVLNNKLANNNAWMMAPFDPLHRKLSEEMVIEQLYDHWTAIDRYENSRWFGKSMFFLTSILTLTRKRNNSRTSSSRILQG